MSTVTTFQLIGVSLGLLIAAFLIGVVYWHYNPLRVHANNIGKTWVTQLGDSLFSIIRVDTAWFKITTIDFREGGVKIAEHAVPVNRESMVRFAKVYGKRDPFDGCNYKSFVLGDHHNLENAIANALTALTTMSALVEFATEHRDVIPPNTTTHDSKLSMAPVADGTALKVSYRCYADPHGRRLSELHRSFVNTPIEAFIGLFDVYHYAGEFADTLRKYTDCRHVDLSSRRTTHRDNTNSKPTSSQPPPPDAGSSTDFWLIHQPLVVCSDSPRHDQSSRANDHESSSPSDSSSGSDSSSSSD